MYDVSHFVSMTSNYDVIKRLFSKVQKMKTYTANYRRNIFKHRIYTTSHDYKHVHYSL